MMEYRGYIALVEVDDVAGILHGEVINTRDVITSEGTSIEELWQALADSVDDYLAFCAERGEEPARPIDERILRLVERGEPLWNGKQLPAFEPVGENTSDVLLSNIVSELRAGCDSGATGEANSL